MREDVRTLKSSLSALPTPIPRPFLVVVSGLPGTGKSSVSSVLSERLGATVLRSDALRRVLFGRPQYSTGESARLFSAVRELVRILLRGGIPVIVDATNLTEWHRLPLYRVADEAGARLVVVKVTAPARLVRERLKRRGSKQPGTVSNDYSEAGWDVYVKMRPTEEKISRRHFLVNTATDIDPTVDRIVRAAARL